MCKEFKQKNINPREDYTTYLLEMDKVLVENWATVKNTSISFRQAGPDTLRCLERGAGAKPHEILDKTLKLKPERKEEPEDSPVKAHNAAVKKFFEDFPVRATEPSAENLLMGLVGHWQKGMVDGLYLTRLGKLEFEKILSDREFDTNAKDMPYLKLENKGQKEALIKYFNELEGTEKHKLYLFNRLFFSGDYDVHDLLQAGKPIPTLKDMELLEELQQHMMTRRIEYLQKEYEVTDAEIEQENRAQQLPDGKFAMDYCRIQHGPQANYTAQMLNENVALMNKIREHFKQSIQEKKPAELNVIVDSVASMDYPVCLYDRTLEGSGWRVLASESDICEYYKSKGLTPKITWVDAEARRNFRKWVIKTSVKLLYPHATKAKKEYILQDLEKHVPGFKTVYDSEYCGLVTEALDEMIDAGMLK